jgi:hypothetical protein
MQARTDLSARSTRLPFLPYEAKQHCHIVRRGAFGLNATLEQNLKMGTVFKLVSIARSKRGIYETATRQSRRTGLLEGVLLLSTALWQYPKPASPYSRSSHPPA